MKGFENVNLTPLSYGVILSPIMETESIVTASDILMEATHQESKTLWKGKCVVVKVGPNVEQLSIGDEVYLNIQTNNKVAFEHKGIKLLWTIENAIFAKINPESKIVL